MKGCCIIDAPSDLGLRRTGVDKLPAALREAGLLEGMPDGLWPEELTEALTVVLASPPAAGIEVTIYNPTFDDVHRSAARTLARAVTSAFAVAT